MKQFLIVGICALFLACGNSSNERGIASVTNDPTATGTAYKINDTVPTSARAQATVNASPASTVSAPAVDTASKPSAAAVAPKVVPQEPAKAAVPTAKPAVADDSAEIKRGEALISKSDCLACHKVQEKLLGPAYKDVAAKYPNNAASIAKLADKIKQGGSGVWGAIPMSPHPALSDSDAKAMVKYILSLK